MKNHLIISFIAAILFATLSIWFSIHLGRTAPKNISEEVAQERKQPEKDNFSVPEMDNSSVENKSQWQSALDRPRDRVSKKYFGIYITPGTSLVQPERFRGYHTGTDFEIFPEELDVPVSISAVCPGKLLLKKYATGYGGVAIQSCQLNSQSITVIYGHLKLASIEKNIGDDLKAGDFLGQLGVAYSTETDGEREHLHLGIHKGPTINLLGYVQAKNELSGWIDPCPYVCD